MKTLKLVLIATILTFVMTSLTTYSHARSIKVINISLKAALQEPGLKAAMYEQLTMEFLKIEKPGYYSTLVTYNKNVYRVYGTRTSWVRFFQTKPINVGTPFSYHKGNQ